MTLPHFTPREDTYEAWLIRLDALLDRMLQAGISGRVRLYLDFRDGEVVAGGELQECVEPWASKWTQRGTAKR